MTKKVREFDRILYRSRKEYRNNVAMFVAISGYTGSTICTLVDILPLALLCLIVSLAVIIYIWLSTDAWLNENLPHVVAEQAQKRSPSNS